MVAPAVTAFVSSLTPFLLLRPDYSVVFNTAVEFYFSTGLVGASIGVYLFDFTGREMDDKVFNLEEGKLSHKQLDCLMRHRELSFSTTAVAAAIVIINLDDNAVLYAQNFAGFPLTLMSDNIPEVNGIVPRPGITIRYESFAIDYALGLGRLLKISFGANHFFQLQI